MYALADCNNFYASCERVFNPALNNTPIVILSNNDGCIIARSNEAKAMGIKMGEPAFKIKDIITENNIAVFSSNYSLYGDLSNRVMNTLSAYTPEIEIYSIDEAFLNLDGFNYQNLNDYSRRICKATQKNTGIPISIGIGKTKTLAKTANYFAKKVPKNKGVMIFDNEKTTKKHLKIIPVGEIWGIGRKYSMMLQDRNVKTALDFTRLSDSFIKSKMSVVGLRTKEELLGNPCISLDLSPSAKKSICTSRSFGEMQTEIKNLEEAVSTFAHSCATKLRNQKTCANIIIVFIHTNAFKKSEAQYARNRVVKLPVSSNNSSEIIKFALIALRSIFKSGYKYKKAGVIVTGIVPETEIQSALFDNMDRPKHKKALSALDELNKRYGRQTVKIASQGNGRNWKLRQEKLSPCYSTNWDDIITITT